jgi:hypothetical protein
MKRQIRSGVVVGVVQYADDMSRWSSAPSIHDDGKGRAKESWVKHIGRNRWRGPEGSAGVVGTTVLVGRTAVRLHDGGRCCA